MAAGNNCQSGLLPLNYPYLKSRWLPKLDNCYLVQAGQSEAKMTGVKKSALAISNIQSSVFSFVNQQRCERTTAAFI